MAKSKKRPPPITLFELVRLQFQRQNEQFYAEEIAKVEADLDTIRRERQQSGDNAEIPQGKTTEAAQKKEHSTTKVEWNENDLNYILMSEAVVTFTENKLSLSKLSRMLTPFDGSIHYMRKGRRCKVHIADFRTWAQKEYPPDSVREEIANELLADRAARQKKIDDHKLP